MILVDSSVWIDYFRGSKTPQADFLDAALLRGEAIAGDLVIAEVLQGFSSPSQAALARSVFDRVAYLDIAGRACALEAAENYRRLRALGITPRKTIGTLIATRCILDAIPLLHADRDFEPFEAHLGLINALTGTA